MRVIRQKAAPRDCELRDPAHPVGTARGHRTTDGGVVYVDMGVGFYYVEAT